MFSERTKQTASLVAFKKSQREALEEERQKEEFVDISDEFQCALAELVGADE